MPNGPQFQRASPWSAPPENQEHVPQTGARDHCRHSDLCLQWQGNFALWTSLHPSTTLTSTFIRKAKWGIIMTPPQRRTALERQQLLPAQRDLSQKAGGCHKGRVANSLGNTKKSCKKDPPQLWKCPAATPGCFQPTLVLLQGQLQHLWDPRNRQIHFTLFYVTRHTWKTQSPCWPTASSGLTAPTAQLCTVPKVALAGNQIITCRAVLQLDWNCKLCNKLN